MEKIFLIYFIFITVLSIFTIEMCAPSYVVHNHKNTSTLIIERIDWKPVEKELSSPPMAISFGGYLLELSITVRNSLSTDFDGDVWLFYTKNALSEFIEFVQLNYEPVHIVSHGVISFQTFIIFPGDIQRVRFRVDSTTGSDNPGYYKSIMDHDPYIYEIKIH